jgi:hypothetical protein
MALIRKHTTQLHFSPINVYPLLTANGPYTAIGLYSPCKTSANLEVFLSRPRSCSRHGLIAVRRTSERPGSVIHLSKNIYCTGSYFTASLPVDIFETGRKRFAVREQWLPSYHLAFSSPREKPASNRVTTVRKRDV